MKVCVLQPDYGPSDVDYKHYDPPRDLSAILEGHTVHHVALNKLTTFRQLRLLSTQGYDIFLNLCEGYPEWEVPSVDVIHSLDRLRLPYTGPTALLYDVPKPLMKYVAYTAGVNTPAHAVVHDLAGLEERTASLRFPLFVKPAHAGDSLGIDARSRVVDATALRDRVRAIIESYGEALIEEYVDGREFTVLVLASVEEGGAPVALIPVEYTFPEGPSFKTYAHKTSALHPEANHPVTEAVLSARLKDAAVRVFESFGGVGYARFDFRMDSTGELFFLELNFTCSVFYRDGYEGSADYVLKYDRMGPRGFAEHIIAEGIARHERQQRPFDIRGTSVSGYGIFATRALRTGDVVFRGEGKAHRIVTAHHAAAWSGTMQRFFRQYAYPLSHEVFALWAEDPMEWAPQNHSCAANTHFDGLNVVASRSISMGEELTLDYAAFMSPLGEPFACRCGTPECTGIVAGSAGNSLVGREASRVE